MKLHLTCRLYRAVQACLVIGTVSVSSFSYATVSLEDELQIPYVDEDKYPRGNTSYASRQTSSLTLSQYVSITFQNIAYSQRSYTSDDAYAYGGAVYISGSTQLFSLSNNGIVSFSGNSASSTAYNANAYAGGGAIWNNGSFSLSNNQYVFFSNNTTSSSSNTSSTASLEGGAIYNKGTFELNGNGGIAFSGNFAAYGGAICNEGSFTLSDNGTLSFSDNSAVCGVVFNAYYASFTLSNNRAVVFSGNSSNKGSAIYNNGTFTLSNNGNVIFNGNKGASSSGGAIYNNEKSTFNLRGNESVSFRLNTAVAFGGAIHNEGIIKLLDNAEILFIDNKVSTTTAEGGAIYNNGSFTVKGTGALSFSGNSATYGSVIYNCGGSSFTLNGNGDVFIRENRASSGGAIYNCEKSTFTLSDNGDIIFSGNKGASSSGGAICNYSGTFTLKGNRKICFSGNNVSTSTFACGSAICNSGVFTLSNNGELTFSDNTASSSAYVVYGSAIYNTGTFSLSSNGDVYFSGNTASSSSSSTPFGYGAICNEGDFKLLDNGDVLFNGNTTIANGCATSFANGCAISNKGTFSLSCNGNISFCNNSTSFSSHAHGGAIYNDRAFSMLDNGCVTFLDNSATDTGGAIYNSGTFNLRRNVAVTFDGNSTTSTYTYGGAIANIINTFTLTDNGAVTFSGNSAFSSSSDPSSSSYAKGGAIYNSNSGGNTFFSLGCNAAVTFIGNTASSASSAAYGGAIFNNSSSVFTLSGNGVVSFCNNNASSYYRSSSRYAEGGAIFNDGAFTISGNGDVTFSGNSVSTVSSSYAMGGAIYNSGDDFHDATFSLCGNGNVLFEKNVEITATSCQLRSIYSNGILNLAASEGKSITFRDTIYAEGEVNMNQDYTDSEGVTHQSTGSIIFTGATTEADLREMKGGVDGTSMEIQNSRFSEIKGTLTLNSGTLIVQDQAQLQTDSLVIKSGGSVMLKNGSIITTADSSCILMDCSLKISSGATLTLCGNLFLSGVVDMEISGFDNGTYTLLSASSITGSDNLAINIVSGDSGTYVVAWNEKGNELMLTVAGTTPPAPPLYERDTPIRHIWTDLSGVLSFGSVIGHDVFIDGDSLEIQGKASIKVSSMVQPVEILVNSASNVTFSSDKKTAGSGIAGSGSVTKSGAGMLTLNAGNSYSGGTVLNAGTIKATAADSFGSGAITVNGGTLDLGGKDVRNDIVLSGAATIKGDAKYAGSVTVEGDATLLAKTSYKGVTAIGAGSSLTLAASATMAGSLAVDGGVLHITAPKGLTLAKNTSLTLDKGGSVRGLLTVGSGSTLVWGDGGFATAAPVLNGGTLDLGGKGSLTLTGSKAEVQFGDKTVYLPGKGIVQTADELTLNSGTVTVNAVGNYSDDIIVNGGTLKLTTGKTATYNTVIVSGDAAVANGTTHYGDITVNGTLAKGTAIKLLSPDQKVELNGSGSMLGTISGTGLVEVKGDVDITAGGKLSNTDILLTGTLTHTKGWTLAKGQTLTLNGGSVNGALNIGSGAVLAMNDHTLSAAPVLKGGTADFGGSHTLALTGSKGDISIENQDFSLLAKSYVKSNGALTVNGGIVTVNDFGGSKEDITVKGGTLKLATGKLTSANTIKVSGDAAVSNGTTHYGDIIVNGTLAKGTAIKLLSSGQKVQLNGAGPLLGSISGAGIVEVNASIDATGATLTAANIALNHGTYTNTKGIRVAKGQTLTLNGAALNLGPKGVLSTAAGSTLAVNSNTSISGSLTLGGGSLVFSGTSLEVQGTLTLSTAMNVTGSGIITYDTLKAAKNVDVEKLFGKGAVLDTVNGTLTFGDYLPMAAVMPETHEEPETRALASAPEPSEKEAETVAALAPLSIPAANPVADALVQSDWAVLETARAFTGSIRNRSMGTLTQDGRGAVWAAAVGSYARHGSEGLHSGSRVNIYGGSIGAEHAVGEHHSLGVALGSTHTMVERTAMSRLRQNATHFALYGNSRLNGKLSADWTAAIGAADMHGRVGATTAEWEQNSGALNARLNYTERLNERTALRAYAGAEYAATDADRVGGYKTGGVQTLRGELGASLTHSRENAQFFAELGLVNDLLRNNPTVDCGGYRTRGANPGRTSLKAAVGGSVQLNESWSANAAYSIESAADATQQSINIGVSRKF